MKKQIIILTAGALSLALLAGCGSGGGSGTPQAAATTALSGTVADGYLANATVFMDKNGNYQLDPGEPSATTDAKGAYTLQVSPTDIGKYPIVAIATKGVTMDLDTNSAVTGSYILSMPAAAVSGTVNVNSNFISPISSEVRELMETGSYTTMQQAMDALAQKLGLQTGTNNILMTNYLATNNTAMHTAAQNMATLMAGQMAQVMGSTASTATTVDLSRYRTMMGTIFSNSTALVGSNTQTTMTSLMQTLTTNLSTVPMGTPFRNISSAFRGMMM